MWVFLRLLIGSIFLVSALSKLFSPYQNFLYAIQAYQLLPSHLEVYVAQIFPWIELLVGFFMLLGLWTTWALKGTCLLFGLFVVVVGQALIRNLPLEQCGCFGEALHVPADVMLLVDSAGILITLLLLRHLDKTGRFSLDSYFDKRQAV